MRKLKISNLAIITALILIAGCNTFFEEDISDQAVKLLSPSTGTTTDIATQRFWWEKIESDSYYHLQIVSPSFDSTEVLVEDTIILSNEFNLTLYPSDFEWRVRAENSVFKSGWTTGQLHILSTSDLTRQKVNLLTPGTISNMKYNRFQWDRLYNAKKYTLIIYKDQWDGIAAIPAAEIDTTFSYQTLNDGRYVWGVKGKNQISETIYTQKNLIVDATPPAEVILSSPADSSEVAGTTVSFAWTSSDATSGISQDTLKIFSDKGLKNLVKTVVSNNGETEASFTEKKGYFWTVRSVDMAGNAGAVSRARLFTIK